MDYVTSVEKAGGLPMPLPFNIDFSLIGDWLNNVDGLLFTGGDDLNPVRWGEPWHPGAEPVNEAREHFEYALLAEAERREIPILGICLGAQVMNVHRGGSLIQYLPEYARDHPLEHRRLDLPMRRHLVTLGDDSILQRHLGRTELDVNTSHKQAIARPGNGLKVVARAPDGVIEAVEDSSRALFLGVQWHPERLWKEAEHLSIFRLLIEKAQGH
jgi:putative glutamine amidotransferase